MRPRLKPVAYLLERVARRLLAWEGFESGPSLHAGPARFVAIYRDYWSGDRRPYRNVLHDREDRRLGQFSGLEPLFHAAGVADGDEVEIEVRRTGRRPFGRSRIVLQGAHRYGPETEEEIGSRGAAEPDDSAGEAEHGG